MAKSRCVFPSPELPYMNRLVHCPGSSANAANRAADW